MSFNTTIYTIDPDTGDLRPISKKTLGDYLSRRTKAEGGNERTGGPDDYTYNPPRPNAFPIKEATFPPAAATMVIQAANTNGQSAFDSKALEDVHPDYFDQDAVFSSTTDPIERHRVLRDVVKGEPDNPASRVLKKQVRVQLSRNRFADSLRFESGQNPDPTVHPSYRLEPYVNEDPNGQQSPPPAPQPSSSNPEAYGNLYEQMREEAIRALILSTGELPFNPPSTTTARSVREPSDVQGNLSNLAMGGLARVDTKNLRYDPLERNEPPPPEQIPGVTEVSFYTSKSYGSLSSWLEPFGGLFSTSLVLAAGILLVTSVVLVIAIATLLSTISRAITKPDASSGDLPSGSERGSDFGTLLDFSDPQAYQDFFAKLLNLIHPYPISGGPIAAPAYLQIALNGITTFCGIDVASNPINISNPVPGLLANTADFTENIAGGPGYYIVIVRNMIRSLDILSINSSDVASAVGTPGSNSLPTLSSLITAMRDSKVLRFVDTMARLGHVQQMLDRRASMNALTQELSAGTEDRKFRQARSRETQGKRNLAWSLKLVNDSSYFLLPRNFKYSSISFSQNDEKIVGAEKSLNGKFWNSVSNFDISSEQVQRLENRLHVEYVPFYFHDLRTNEILNFPAFIENLTDSYTANYNSVDSYGRMDPVQIYKNTTRSLGVDFMLVATNPDDFDRMWWAINRLTMMVYPQWSSGEELQGIANNGETYTFTQPFSQVPTSSPLIRLRIGELIHSNYSRFNLARIFGLGGSSSQSGDRHLTLASESGNTQSIDALSSRTVSGFEYSINPYDTIDTLKDRYANVGVKLKRSFSSVPTSEDLNDVLGINSEAPYSYYYEADTEATIVDFKQIDIQMYAILKIAEPKQVTTIFPDGSSATFVTNYISIDANEIAPTNSYLSRAQGRPSVPSDLTMSADTLLRQEFGDSSSILNNQKGNAVVRSFESSGGRGLAGVITSLTYTWYDDNTTWEISPGKRAPMMCKISIAFSPIHDIPMGLDQDGIARSVPYPVGDTVRSVFFPELYENLD